MNNFMVRVWDGKNQQMIYPGECFEWTISLCGEVFRGDKHQEDCEILPFSGVYDVNVNEIYEGDIVSTECRDKYQPPINGKSIIKYKDGEFDFRSRNIEWLVCKQIVKDFKIKVIDNIYEKAKRKERNAKMQL